MTKPSDCLSLLFSALVAFVIIVQPANAQQRFGSSIVISNGELIIAESENLYRPGALYVYAKDNGTWIERAAITAPNAQMGDHFGEHISVDGDRLLVGATGVEGTPGAAHVYERENDTWVHRQALTAADVSAEDRYGAEVVISGNFAFVGAPAGSDAPGRVYVFERGADGSWEEHSTLQGSVATNGANFGARLAANGHNAFIGAPRQNEDTGAVYRFSYDAAADSWTESQVLGGRLAGQGDRFGSALVLTDEALFVGVPHFGNRVGTTIVFQPDPNSGEWTNRTLLLPFAAANPSGFGTAVAVSDDEVWVGAPYGDGFSGSAYTFTLTEEAFVHSKRLPAANLESRDMFGSMLDVDGDLGAVAILGADYGAGSVAVYERDGDGAWSETARLESEAAGLEPVVGGQVDCKDGTASLFDCERVNLLSFLPISSLGGKRGVQLNDIWGWTDPSTGREYAIVGRVDGTSFVDVTDPYNPIYIGDLPKTEGSRGSAWRDMKVYNDHVFIVADNAGEHGMQVFDLTLLRNASAPVTFEEVAIYDGINSAHNIVINTETGFAYAVGSGGGGETCGGGLHMINIEDPTNPTFAGCYAAAGTGRAGTGYTHDAQCISYNGPDSEYAGREICFGSNETALNVADVTDKENPESIATASYPNVSYTHQGWISEDQRFFYVNDELDELSGNASETRTLIWDVTDLDDPQLVKEYMWGTQSSDHNLYIRDNLMYQSNYVSGLRIHDLTDPVNPVEIGFFDTMPIGDNDPGFAGSWSNYPFFESGTIAVSSIDEGLFLLKKSEEPGL